jgi:hypothetical protein
MMGIPTPYLEGGSWEMNEKAHSKSQMFLSAAVILIATFPTIHAQTNDAETLRQRVLRASHLSRINDVEMKPWHLKIKYQLFDPKGKPAEVGTIEEWWGGLTLWKQRVESPSYTATVIENRGGDFRTQGVGPIPLEIRAIEQSIVYPMPMGEDLSRTIPHQSHLRLANVALNCVQLGEPPISVPSAKFCLDSDSVLRAIYSANSSSVLRGRTKGFQGHSVALSVTTYIGSVPQAQAEVSELTETKLADDIFTPSTDMAKTTDMHTFKVTTAK